MTISATNRPRPAVVLCSFVLSLFILCIMFVFISDTALSDVVPKKGTRAYYLWEFEQRLHKYEASQSTKAVIVGSSYAWNLGEFGGIHNLAFPSGTGAEWIYSARNHCRPSDLVFCIFTIRDFCSSEYDVVRTDFAYDVPRQLTILRGSVDLIGTRQRAYSSIPQDQSDLLTYRLATGCNHISGFNEDYSVRRINSMFSTTDVVDISECVSLFRDRPNVRFVLHPMLRMRDVGITTKMARHITHINQEEQRMIDMFHENNLPLIDLRDTVVPSDYADFIHLKASGLNKIRSALIAMCSSN